MKIYTNIKAMPFIDNAVVTLGTFDGVHTAHRKIAEEVCLSAKKINGKSVVISFADHPRKIIDPEFPLKILTTTEEKNILLKQIGIDIIIYIDFTENLAQMNYAEFVKLLTKKIDIKKIVVGYNHNFGKNKEGNIQSLTELIPIYGFEIVEIPQQTFNGIKISSSSIRKAIDIGDIKLANSLLGYNYSIETDISPMSDNEMLAMQIDDEKIRPPKGKYEVKIHNETTLLKIKKNMYVQTYNFSFLTEKQKTTTIEFLNQKNKRL